MTAQERAAVVEAFSKRIRENGFFRLAGIKGVFDAAGLDRGLYAALGPKRWIQECFPEFVIVGSNGKETVWDAKEPMAAVYRVLDEAVEQNGQVLIAQLPKYHFEPAHINYKDYAGSKKLTNWLPAVFPEFGVTEDNRFLYRQKGVTPCMDRSQVAAAPVPAAGGADAAGSAEAPVSPEPSLSPDELAEIQKMHSTAFMNWWNNNAKRLKAYNEKLTEENQLKKRVAHRMTAVFLGERQGLIDAAREEESRIAFDTGLKSRAGSPIYCVLIPNPQDAEEGRLRWMMLDFACPEDETALGQWLRDHQVTAERPSAGFAVLEEQVRRLDRKREEILPLLGRYVELLSQGRLPEQEAAGELASFEEQAERLRELYRQVWNQPYPAEADLRQVAEQVGGKTAALQRLKSAVELFDAVAEQTEELFARNRLPLGEEPSPRKDREALRRQYGAPEGEPDLGLFQETLRPYQVLRRLMEATAVSDELGEAVETVLVPHFPELSSYRNAVRTLIEYEEAGRAYLGQLDAIEEQLRDCRSLTAAPSAEAEPAQRTPMTAAELLETLSEQDAGAVSVLEWAQCVYPDREAERRLVLGDLEGFRSYLEAHPEDPLATPENRALAEDRSLSRARTCRAAAERLRRAEGSGSPLAEAYGLLGMVSQEKGCDTALLELYREEGRPDAFRKVWKWSDAAGSLEDQVYYLSLLGQEDPAQAAAYAQGRPYLFYRKDSLSLLRDLPAGTFGPEEVQSMEERLGKLEDVPPLNGMEQAVAEGDLPRIRQLAADPAGLSAMGYGPEEIQRLTQAAAGEAASDCESREDYDVGLRLYRFQKNLHGLAEQYMWKGIAANPQIHGSHLMLVLAQEGRWQECCRLYEAYTGRYAEDSRCRQLYLIARLRRNPAADTQAYVREHLQDCLWMLDTVPLVQAAFQELAQSEPDGIRDFYGTVGKLRGYLEDPLLKSVVILDRNLREYASEAYAREQGVPEALARKVGEVYRADRYPKGMDAVSLAQRLCQFVGTYRGASEAFARFALPDPQAAGILWNLYRELGEEEEAFRLMRTYPSLRETHREEYGAMLFQQGAYGEFLENCAPEADRWSQQLEAFTAELKLYPETRTPLPALPDLREPEALEWFRRWGGRLTAALAEAGRRPDLERLLFDGFSAWLDGLPEEALRQVVTGEGSIPAALLEPLQQDALEQGQEELALYLYQNLQVGDLSGRAQQFREAALARLEEAPARERLSGLRRLQRLNGQDGAPDSRMARLELRLIQEDPSLDPEQEAAEMGRILERYPAEPEAVEALLPLLEDPDRLGRYPVYAGLARLAEKTEDPRPVLRFFQRAARMPETENNGEFRGFVCRLSVKAFVQGQFPEELAPETAEWCASYCRQYQTAEGFLCLYFVEKALGQDAYAFYLLRRLADRPADQLGEEMGQILADQLQSVWGASLPSYFELFRDYLLQAPVEEAERYLAFASLACGEEEKGTPGPALEREGENRMLSESESNALLRQLYADPRDAAVWRSCTRLPLQDNPVAYAKLLFLACARGAFAWQECAEYGEKYEQWDLLLRTLLFWAKSAPAEEVAACRIFLEQRLTAHPDYFARWSGREELLALSGVLGSRVPQTEVEYHATLRSVSLIAVKTGFPEAISHLMDRFGKALLGSCCNLGVVTAVHLLLEGRYTEAGELLGMLRNVLGKMNYRELVDSLAGLSPEELARWTADAENHIMLNMVLPDGNTPNLQQINALVGEGIQKGRARETAHVLCRMRNMFPDDYGIYNALYDLCCTEFEGFLPILHQCLRGLARLQPARNAQSYYRREPRQYARMLAALDALLLANGLTGEVPDYDFTQDTGEFYRRVGAASMPYSESVEVSAVREQVLSALSNRSQGEQARLSLGYRSCITGNWLELLRGAWEKQEEIQAALGCQLSQVEDIGFGRSVLRLLLETEEGQRNAVIQWLRRELGLPRGARPQSQRQKQLQFAEDFVSGGCFRQLENQIEFGSLASILETPFEDYSLSVSVRERYVDAAIRKDSEQLYALALLTGALICHSGYQTELSKKADSLFEQGDDRHASGLYRAMHQLQLRFGLTHIDFRTGKSISSSRKAREEYEARYRVTALFSRNREVMAKVGSSHFHVWSCINLVLTLAYSPRADEVGRLIMYLNKENAQLAQAVMRGLDPTVPDAEKLEAVDTLYSDVAKAYYCYVVKYPYNPYHKDGPVLSCASLADTRRADEMNRRYQSLAQSLVSQRDTSIGSRLMPAHFLLLDSKGANAKISRQRDPQLWNVSEETVDSGETDPSQTVPFFAEGKEALYGPESLESLEEEHRGIQRLAGTVQAKAALSEKIYRRCLADGTAEQRQDALLLMGSDCYYRAFSSGDTQTANQAVLALAGLLKHSQAGGYGGEEARKAMPNALYGLLQSFQTLGELLECYGEHRSLFHYMRGLLNDPLLMACVGQIYRVLDSLRNSYASAARENPEILREDLSVGYRQLEGIETNRWMELKNRVQKLINDAINELDQRPVLRFEVLNPRYAAAQRSFGSLSGQVRNIGQAPAREVVIQASYSDNTHSRPYALSSLAPGSQAVFELDYDCAADTERLGYLLNVTFSHNGKQYAMVADKGEIRLGQTEPPDYPADLLCREANGIAFQTDPETGEVYSPDFVGRKEETAMLRSLVEGKDFGSYRSALVYGIRRTGKTTLLNYLAAYIQSHCPQVLCVKTDCQTIRGSHPIQFVFVDQVLDEAELQLPALESDSRWAQLREKWSGPAYCADREPEKLSLFYRKLKQALEGRGLYLIIDEIDRLFQRVEESRQGDGHRNLEGFFGALSGMLNQAECREAVHFVFCGSNWLIRYNLKGEKNNQLFQRFGQQVIEVGKLPEADMQEVIRRPYQAYPQLQVTPEAMQWIWNYTGGLVWHTKLLAQEAIERAWKDWRGVVYPADVQQSAPRVVTDMWCKQFYEGCESGEEYRLIDAMQSLASRRNAFIHIDRIRELLGQDPLELQRSMNTLLALKVAARHPVNQQLYGFAQDIYRRYFRTQPSRFEQVPEDPEIFQAAAWKEPEGFPPARTEPEAQRPETPREDYSGLF